MELTEQQIKNRIELLRKLIQEADLYIGNPYVMKANARRVLKTLLK